MAEGHAVVRWVRALAPIVNAPLLDVYAPPRWRARAEQLVGRRITHVRAHGKHHFLETDSDLVIHCHAMQYGSWQLGARGMPLRKLPRYVRLRLVTETHEAVFYHGPVMEILTTGELASDARVGALGPDLLHEEFDRDEVFARLRAAGRRQIGDAILDQRIVAGIGNIYKSEGLFLATIDPLRTARSVTRHEMDVLFDALIPLMLEGAAQGPGRTMTLPAELLTLGEYNWVYRRTRRPCLVCATDIRMVRQGELRRMTYYCPNCQH